MTPQQETHATDKDADLWMIMRGAMDAKVNELYRKLHVPTSNTSNGLIILENA